MRHDDTLARFTFTFACSYIRCEDPLAYTGYPEANFVDSNKFRSFAVRHRSVDSSEIKNLSCAPAFST